MAKTISTLLLFIFIFHTLQSLAQECISSKGPYRNKRTVEIKVTYNGFIPDCLTIYDGQSVVWGKLLIMTLPLRVMN
jgi:hypothetical protein